VAAARTARQIFALAGGTFREAIRMKAFAAPTVFAVTAVALSPFLPSDGTPAGAVRLAVSVCLLTATIFGTFAAVMLAALLPAREKRDRTDFLVATKPVPRWGLYAGRALGLSAVLAAMFAGMAMLSWVFVRYTASREASRRDDDRAKVAETLTVKTESSAGDEARAEVAEALTVRTETSAAWETGPVRLPDSGARKPVTMPRGSKLRWRFMLPPASRHIERFSERFCGRVEIGDGASSWPEGLVVRAVLPDGTITAATWADLEPLAARMGRRFELGREQVWFDELNRKLPGLAVIEIENTCDRPVVLGAPAPVVLQIGANAYVSPGAAYVWRFRLPKGSADPAFRFRASRATEFDQEVQIEIRGSEAAGPVTRKIMLEAGGPVLIKIAPEFIPEDGVVTAELRNSSEGGVHMQVGKGLVFSPRGGTFAGALLRWAAIEIAKVIFLVLLISAGAMALSFPIPALLGGAVAAGGYLVSFAMSLIASGAHSGWMVVFEGILRGLLPDLAGATVAGSVAHGNLVPAWSVLEAALFLVVVRGGILAALGGWLAAKREVDS